MLQNTEHLGQVLKGSLRYVGDILQKVEQNWEEILLSELWPQDFSALVDGKCKAPPNLPAAVRYHLVVHRLKLSVPVVSAQSFEDCGEVVGAVVGGVVVHLLHHELLAVFLVVADLEEVVEEVVGLVHLVEAEDEGAEVLEGRYLDPLR